MYSTVYFKDESGNNYAILGIKCEHNVPNITTKDDTIILTNVGDKVYVREDNSTKDWQEFFELSFEEGRVVVKFKTALGCFNIRPYAYSWKVDFEIMGCEP